ncbi:GntR family transcriptional regulator [Trueperella pecoris]|uniref:GntR family transcriptional regulator n=1 Tax=Trueperella pecoris TaxID=2733571 RepID=UPI00186BA7CE|nr:GntR family transcriptional regulator [Trueperella pecoris]QOQ39207.1 GntR family transcriptional regulator [Trueperella pecoris]QTG75986.1 GntR family transcriptional regulator [Trueperella pecoris]
MALDDSRPIWIQLAENFGQKIICGEWEPGVKIPSVRELALEQGVNPNTIQRALNKLDDDGLTVPARAQGRFVTDDESVIQRRREEAATALTDRHIAAVQGLGLNLDGAANLLKQRWISSN